MILSSVHITAPSHLPVTVHCHMQFPLLWDRLSSHFVMVSLQVSMILTRMVNAILIFYLGNNIGIVLWSQGMSRHLRCEKSYMKHVLYLTSVLSPFLFIPSLYAYLNIYLLVSSHFSLSGGQVPIKIPILIDNGVQWNLQIMKVLGQPIFFHCLEVFFIERYKCIEVHANGTLENYERFFIIGRFHYWRFQCTRG